MILVASEKLNKIKKNEKSDFFHVRKYFPKIIEFSKQICQNIKQDTYNHTRTLKLSYEIYKHDFFIIKVLSFENVRKTSGRHALKL